jgi:hypothetical protein
MTSPQHLRSSAPVLFGSSAPLAILDGKGKAGRVPELWDGRAAEGVMAVLRKWVQ